MKTSNFFFVENLLFSLIFLNKKNRYQVASPMRYLVGDMIGSEFESRNKKRLGLFSRYRFDVCQCFQWGWGQTRVQTRFEGAPAASVVQDPPAEFPAGKCYYGNAQVRMLFLVAPIYHFFFQLAKKIIIIINKSVKKKKNDGKRATSF